LGKGGSGVQEGGGEGVEELETERGFARETVRICLAGWPRPTPRPLSGTATPGPRPRSRP
jgi:hypothetical protein